MLTSPLELTFDDLLRELCALGDAWTCDRERAALRFTASDLRHHVCAFLPLIAHDDHAHYDTLGGEARVLAHEAYLAVLALGQLLLRAIAERMAPDIAIARVQQEVERMLDLLAPLVSRADTALRRVLLDEVPLETALAEVGCAP